MEGQKEVLRDPGEEGLFVGEKPYLTRTNLNIIENQLLTQGNRWVGCVGSYWYCTMFVVCAFVCFFSEELLLG